MRFCALKEARDLGEFDQCVAPVGDLPAARGTTAVTGSTCFAAGCLVALNRYLGVRFLDALFLEQLTNLLVNFSKRSLQSRQAGQLLAVELLFVDAIEFLYGSLAFV